MGRAQFAWAHVQRVATRLAPYRDSEQYVHLAFAQQLVEGVCIGTDGVDPTRRGRPPFDAARRRALRRVVCCLDNELMLSELPVHERALINDVRCDAMTALSRVAFVRHQVAQMPRWAILRRAARR